MADIDDEKDVNLPEVEDSKLIEAYRLIDSSEDIALKTSYLLSITNSYLYSKKISDEINARQGKNRTMIDYETRQLMEYESDSDIDKVTDNEARKLTIDVLNSYLSDKMELPNNTKQAAGILSRVKALFMILVMNNLIDIIKSKDLIIPNYMIGKIATILEKITQLGDDITDSWIQWLEDHNNHEMAEIVRNTRGGSTRFWGSEGLKAEDSFNAYFGGMLDRINNYEETYAAYLEFRANYRKSTRNTYPSKIYDIFEITPDAYQSAKNNVKNELEELYPKYKNTVIKLLIYE